MTRASIVLYALAGLLFSCRPKEQTVKPEIKTATEAVYASGTLVAEKEYKVVPSIDGYLTHVSVEEGDSITAGELLFTVKNETRSAQQQSAFASLEKTLPIVNKNAPVFKELQNELQLANQKLQNDSLQYTRYKNLYDNTAISKSVFEKYSLQYQSTHTEVQKIRDRIKAQQLNNALQKQQASNQWNISRTDNSNGLLRSFTAGIVYEIYKQKGDMVNMNQPVALVGSRKMIAKLSVDEDDLGKVWIGQKVEIKMDAFPDKIFKATITKIYPILNKAEQSFRADADFAEPLPTNIYGLNIEANLLVSENRKVVTIPKKNLLRGDSVLLKKDGKTVKVKIKRGIEDDELLQVKTGVYPSSLLIYIE